MKLNLGKSGLMVFDLKGYEVEILRCIWLKGSVDSKTIHQYVTDVGLKASRASVINSLHKLRDRGIINETFTRVSGGEKGVYVPNVDDESDFIDDNVNYVLERLREEFPNHLSNVGRGVGKSG